MAAPNTSPDLPANYAARKLSAALPLWRGRLGALQRAYGLRAAPGIDPAAWAGFGTNASPDDAGGSARFWELGWAGVEGGSTAEPPPNRLTDQPNTWFRLHDNARVIALLNRPATMEPGRWRQIEDQTAVGIVGLLDHGYGVAEGIDARIRPSGSGSRDAFPATVGGLWFTALAFMGWSAGTSRAVRLVNAHADALALVPEDGRLGLLIWLYASAAVRGDYRHAPSADHDNPLYTLVRTGQKLAAGAAISAASGGDASFFSLRADGDWAWAWSAITTGAFGGDASAAGSPSAPYRYNPPVSAWKRVAAVTAVAAAIGVAVVVARRRGYMPSLVAPTTRVA